MSNRTYTNMINYVYTTLLAETGSGGVLESVGPDRLYLGEEREETRSDTPAVIVRLPKPAGSEVWGLVANKGKRGDMQVEVSFAIEPTDKAWPYGIEASDGVEAGEGYLTLMEDVMNVIENGADGLRLGGNAVSINVTMSGHNVNQGVYTGQILIDAYTYFPAGQR